MANENKQGNAAALTVLTTVFFGFGLITSLNGILIPHLQGLFELKIWQSNLMNFAFFIAFFTMGTPAGIIVKKIGYKSTTVLGLFICAIGAMLYFPSGSMQSFPLFLIATFVIATGVTVIQTSVNPIVTLLGDPANASSRLNNAQALNSLGTTLAPWFGNLLILMVITETMSKIEKAKAVQMPYGIVAGVFVLLAVLILAFRIPEPKKEEKKDGATGVSDPFENLHKSAWGYKHLLFGVFAIFAYVGAEVAIGNNIIFFLKDAAVGGLTSTQAAPYVSIYWGGAMIGRLFAGLWFNKEGSAGKKWGISILYIILALVIGVFVTTKPLTMPTAESLRYGLMFMGIAVANFIAFQIGKKSDRTALGVFGLIAATLVVVAVLSHGKMAMWALISVGFFNSLMFPTIFSLAVNKLGKHTPEGSGALIMGIVGGAIIPVIYGFMADAMGSQKAFIICVVCYLFIAFFGLKGSHPEEVKAKA